MLIFPFEDFLLPFAAIEKQQTEVFSFGEETTLTILLSYHANCGVEKNSYTLLTENTLFITKGIVKVFPFEGSHIYAVAIKGTIANTIFESFSTHNTIQISASAKINNYLQQAVLHYKQKDIAQSSAAIYQLLCQLISEEKKQTLYPPLVNATIALIRERYSEFFGIEEIADILGVSKNHLIRVFKQHMGISPGQYMTDVRIEEAKRLLQHLEIPLEIVANLSGFSGSNYFCKVFKKNTGISPTQWRILHKMPVDTENFSDLETNFLYL